MRPPPGVPKFREYVRILASSWAVIVCATILSGGAGWLVWHNQHNVYADARFFVVTAAGAQPLDAQYGNNSSLSKTVTFRTLAQSSQVLQRTIAETGSSQTPAELGKRVTIGIPEAQSVMLELRVTGKEPNETRDTANAVARTMVALSNEIEAMDTGDTGLVLVDPATGVSDGRAPLWREVLTAAALGGAVSVFLVAAMGLIEGRVLDRSQLAQIVGETTPRRDVP